MRMMVGVRMGLMGEIGDESEDEDGMKMRVELGQG